MRYRVKLTTSRSCLVTRARETHNKIVVIETSGYCGPADTTTFVYVTHSHHACASSCGPSAFQVRRCTMFVVWHKICRDNHDVLYMESISSMPSVLHAND